MSDDYPVKSLCDVLLVSRRGYYQWRAALNSDSSRQETQMQASIAQIHRASRGTYGSPRVTAVLRKQSDSIGRHRVARLMREAGLQGRQRRRYRVRTTDSNHDQPVAPNRLKVADRPTRIDEVWVSDITYVSTQEGWLYLAGVLDLYSRRLIGWAMGSGLETALPLAALLMALRHRRPPVGVVHHSDRGCQYASSAYRSTLKANGCVASMSRRGNCYDNAAMEAFWSTLKHELVYCRDFRTRAEATTAIFDYIESFYNQVRLHSALGYQSPLDYEANTN
ncbi:MAG: IS3 family transposase [Opitutaceae bacterium]|nr:IS3 family transposase [Opitutaceae bacterium]|tara:strand:+ start:228 stop:1064 length:837 start_codon:yes stop_codon:yes gene_type:complete